MRTCQASQEITVQTNPSADEIKDHANHEIGYDFRYVVIDAIEMMAQNKGQDGHHEETSEDGIGGSHVTVILQEK